MNNYLVVDDKNNVVKIISSSKKNAELNSVGHNLVEFYDKIDLVPGTKFIDGKVVYPEQTAEEKAAKIRADRDFLIAQTDWTQLPDVSIATREKWQQYRQNLRDISKQSGFPDNINWPEKPE